MKSSIIKNGLRDASPGKDLSDDAIYKSVLFGKLDEMISWGR